LIFEILLKKISGCRQRSFPKLNRFLFFFRPVFPLKRKEHARASRKTPEVTSEKLNVKISTLGEDAGVLGGAILVLKNIFVPRVSYVVRKSIQF